MDLRVSTLGWELSPVASPHPQCRGIILDVPGVKRAAAQRSSYVRHAARWLDRQP
jgi:hypothetical protein